MLKNLERLVARVERGISPVHVCEVWAFGSFIRGKAEPGDIDLVLFYRPDQELDAKVRALQALLKSLSESDKANSAIWEAAKRRGGMAGIAPEIASTLGFAYSVPVDEWLEHARADWRHNARTFGIFNLSFNPIEITRLVLTKNLHHMQVVRVGALKEKIATTDVSAVSLISDLKARSYRLLWREGAGRVQDFLPNVEASASEARELERQNFSVVSDQLEGEYEMIKAGIGYVLDCLQSGSHPISQETTNAMTRAGLAIGLKKSFMEWALVDHSSFERFEGAAREVLPVEDVETLRKRARSLQRKVPFARYLLFRLSSREEAGEKNPILYRVYLALSGMPFNEAPEESRREVLTEFRLGDVSNKVLLVTLKGKRNVRGYRISEASGH